MDQLLYAEKNYHGLSINCKLRKAHLLTESAMSAAFSQSTVFFSAQIQFTIFHVSSPQSILSINQSVDQGARHATENSIEYATIQPSEHQSERHRSFIQSARRSSRILSENEEFEKTPEFQFLRYQSNFRNDVRYQSNSRNDVRYQSNFRNDVRYQPDLRDNKYQLNLRNEVRSDRNETRNDRYNFRSQDAKKQKFYYENIYQQQPSSHSAVESVHSVHQSVHSPPPKIPVRSHTPQIQSIRRSIPQRPHTVINQPPFTYQNLSFHRATDQPGILPDISQPRYVFAVSSAPIYVSATGNASVYAFTNASVYILVYASGNAPANTPAYAFTYASAYAPATGYGPATGYASEPAPAPASARASRSEMAVLD